MTHKLELELEFITDLSPLELASKIEQAVREALEAMRQSLGCELEFDIFLSCWMGVRCVLPWSRCELFGAYLFVIILFL